MEWCPDDPSGHQMRLTNLGKLCTDRVSIPEGYHRTIWAGRGPLTTPELLVATTVRHITTEQERTQTAYVYVAGELQNPIQDAAVGIVVLYPSGN